MRSVRERGTATVLAMALLLTLVLYAPQRVEAAGNYSIYVNVDANVVTVYDGDQPARAMICSTGGATPRSGTYRISNQYTWRMLFGGVSGQYASRIVGSILFHSVPYTRYGNNASLETDQFDRLGEAASMGCVRLMAGDAQWIFANCPSGTPVTFYADAANPGALGYPYVADISGFDPSFASWDPTDTNPSNPWNELLGYAFDAEFYLASNPDLYAIAANWNENTLKLHWLTAGIVEGRASAPQFNLAVYKANHPELAAQFGDNNYAYVQYFNQLLNSGETVYGSY